ncbi:DUF2235 domain-containing protein [Chryseobacterium sp. Ch-15]|uniref:DUF2235 domain-containing protein n=1 Tax=Chryseobacterium muglaense TaxID=2893752 RepID=A0A9Q3V134_9FLAO|nr:DUF2235 domain-containing protein [Chryseobacterium muglaense]MBD3906716.1 DUF2235 domain-containing protein [Chryseobacterium muglaense]MCC9036620.1 DUF2235 domain-containing protein [Chryseobacterium muglaense]MCM2556490.1 DUF2235 domain-containing protein [Chryseobacterium muglaense]
MGKTFVYNTGNPEPSSIGKLNLTYGIFFDGTRNNLKNTEIRKKVEKKGEFRYISATEEERIIFEKYAKEDNSFGNDFTNVARKYMCTKKDIYSLYVEGIATIDKADDEGDGFKYGRGETGVVGKVRNGCKALADKVFNIYRSMDRIEEIELTIDIFGFSRGAAAARNFAYNLQMAAYAPKIYFPQVQGAQVLDVDHEKSEWMVIDSDWVKEGLLPKFGHLGTSLLQAGIQRELVDSMIINVRFIGVYDTVASYDPSPKVGLIPSFKKKIGELHLHELGSPRKAVHFTAADEHRENFSLTRFLPVELRTGIEKNFPGVHSDVGGSYNHDALSAEEISKNNYKPDPADGVTESEYVWLDTAYFSGSLHDFRNELIEQGWFKKEQLKIGKEWNYRNLAGSTNVLSGTRYLYRGYSFIPLHFMCDYALPYLNENEEYLFYSKITTDYALNDPFLDKVKTYLKEHLIDNNESWTIKDHFNYEDDNDNPEPEENDDPIVESNSNENVRGIELEEVVITSYVSDFLLRKLRNRYLHRSAKLNSLFDTLAYKPAEDRKRMEF